MFSSQVPIGGSVAAYKIPKYGFYAPDGERSPIVLPDDTPVAARMRTAFMEAVLRARLAAKGFARGLSKGQGVFGVGRLYVSVLRRDGTIQHLGLVSTRVITDAGVAFMVDDWDNNATDITTLNFHGCGTGTNAAQQTDTALQTESTAALNPDNTRATGTKSQPSANVLRTVGTVTFDGTAAITEHGLFSQAATGGGTLFDRHTFAAINVVSGDSIQFTYDCTLSAGG